MTVDDGVQQTVDESADAVLQQVSVVLPALHDVLDVEVRAGPHGDQPAREHERRDLVGLQPGSEQSRRPGAVRPRTRSGTCASRTGWPWPARHGRSRPQPPVGQGPARRPGSSIRWSGSQTSTQVRAVLILEIVGDPGEVEVLGHDLPTAPDPTPDLAVARRPCRPVCLPDQRATEAYRPTSMAVDARCLDQSAVPARSLQPSAAGSEPAIDTSGQ